MGDATSTTNVVDGVELDFDPDALREKYRQERDKRLRSDGNKQYVEVRGKFQHYVDDPHTDSDSARAPLTDSVDVLIIGGGFGGLMAGARLRQAGIKDIRIIDQAGDFGGNWYWNNYPGAACDTESYIYLPLLEETGYIPKEKYSFQPEVLEHARRIGKKFDLYRNACFRTKVRSLTWSEEECKWIVTTDRDDRMKARFVVMPSGLLSYPKLPGVPGIETFKGHSFHTSRWDYEYTGGDTTGNLHKLADKRVAVIGTGASAIQVVPHVARSAEHLYVFQRTPSSVNERVNRPTDPEWVKTLKPGWQQHRMDNFVACVSGGHVEEDLVNDAWTDVTRNLGALFGHETDGEVSPEEMARAMEIADFRKMNEVRARVDACVKDPKTAEALKPWYSLFCKRPTLDNQYLDCFNRPNVTLVDTQGHGVDRITEKGLVVDGVEYEVDCIIFSTGFEVGTEYASRVGIDVYGRDGRSLSEYWADGPRTFHGFYTAGFPNCFHMGVIQTGVVVNFVHMLNEQACHIADVIQQVEKRGAKCIEATAEAEAEWVETIREKARAILPFQESCTPGLLNNEGMPEPGGWGLVSGSYGGGPIEFYELIRKWRADEDLKGVEIS